MHEIDALIPSASTADVAALAGVDAERLARYVLDADRPWWRRKAAALAIAGQVPDAAVPELLACVRDDETTGAVRIALLDVLADRTELLPWLRHPDRAAERSYGLPEAVLRARGRLGDRTAVPELAALAHDPWPHRAKTGAAGLDALVARYGLDTILGDLDDRRPADRAFRLRARHQSGADVTDALADPDVTIARLAYSLVDDADAVRAFADHAPTTDAALWAACALHRLGHPADTRRIYDLLGQPRVEVPGLDEEIRTAVLRRYAPGRERSDPRWRAEALCRDLPPPPDEDTLVRRATAALDTAGLSPAPAVSCGDHHGQGHGTYWVLQHAGGHVLVSTLGPFATGDDENTAARTALTDNGFRWIDRPLGMVVVTGLCVYHFGDRDPLNVHTLLFYWQD
jgi:hypothetical protein